MIRLAVRVGHEHADAVLAELVSLVPAGFEERDVDGGVEYVLYGAPGELPDIGEVRAATGRRSSTTTRAARRLGRELAQLPQARSTCGALTRAAAVGAAARGRLDVVIDPGQAFGTGSHATTRLTLELLTRSSPTARSPTGAAAAACSRSPPRSSAGARCSRATSSRSRWPRPARRRAVNGVTVEVTRCDVRHGGPPAPTVLANLVRPLLLEVAASLTRVPERMIISGVELHEVDEVVAAFGGAARGRAPR